MPSKQRRQHPRVRHTKIAGDMHYFTMGLRVADYRKIRGMGKSELDAENTGIGAKVRALLKQALEDDPIEARLAAAQDAKKE